MLSDVALEISREHLIKHYMLPPEYKSDSSELDRVYGAFTVYDRAANVERVICPLCGWVSDKPLPRPSFRDDARPLYFSRIASIIMNHVRRSHPEIRFQRIRKGCKSFGITIRALYRCEICGKEEDGVVEILSHYLAMHLSTEVGQNGGR
jgi:hypothetical protein